MSRTIILPQASAHSHMTQLNRSPFHFGIAFARYSCLFVVLNMFTLIMSNLGDSKSIQEITAWAEVQVNLAVESAGYHPLTQGYSPNVSLCTILTDERTQNSLQRATP
jgi:hypothetical protein